MQKPRILRKETLKTLLLVVLFILTILLLYFFWGGNAFKALKSSFDDIIGGSYMESDLSVSDVTRPEEIIVNFGSDLYTVVSQDDGQGWFRFLEQVSVFSQADGISAEAITPEQYDEIMDYRSIRAEFLYDIPFNDFCTQYNLKWISGYDQIKTVTVLGYSTGSPESLFLYDGRNDQYYRLVAPSDGTGFAAMIEEIQAADNIPCYSAGAYFGIENNAVIPLSYATNMEPVPCSHEEIALDEDSIRKFAQTFFGENLDFIRKITESKGTIIYMYGYSEKVLSIYPNGRLEYREELDAAASQQTYFDALGTALKFVNAHGGWFSSEQQEACVHKVIPIERDRASGYRFVFKTSVNGTDIHYGEGSAITVEVVNGQVVYYFRNLLEFDRSNLRDLGNGEAWEAYPAVNVIAQNYGYIDEVLKENDIVLEAESQEILFDQIAQRIDYMKAGYLWQPGEERLIPSWVVILGDITVYFNLLDASPLGYTAGVTI